MIDVRTTPAPIETVTPIKPSEALRLGRLLVPARSVLVLARYRRGQIVSACAMGAMAVGAGESNALTEAASFWWPGGWDTAPRVTPPCVCPPRGLNWQFQTVDPLPGRRVYTKHRAWRAPVVVAHLSDVHGQGSRSRGGDSWPTARIADWLESLGL